MPATIKREKIENFKKKKNKENAGGLDSARGILTTLEQRIKRISQVDRKLLI